ncbi:MAG: hypothetical protein ACOX7B_03465 [Christensenellales bacterium]|jgi:hypothetical protein
MNNKHFEITFRNGRWPLVRKTADAVDAFECVANLLDATVSPHASYKTGFLMAIASMVEGKSIEHSSQGICVRLVPGDVRGKEGN